jgi:hypothetical protein
MSQYYTEQDKSRMKYFYKEMAEKLKLHPRSLPLINGMAHIERVCGLPQVTVPVDPLAEIDKQTETLRKNLLQ